MQTVESNERRRVFIMRGTQTVRIKSIYSKFEKSTRLWTRVLFQYVFYRHILVYFQLGESACDESGEVWTRRRSHEFPRRFLLHFWCVDTRSSTGSFTYKILVDPPYYLHPDMVSSRGGTSHRPDSYYSLLRPLLCQFPDIRLKPVSKTRSDTSTKRRSRR